MQRLLLAQSGLFERARLTSPIGGKADTALVRERRSGGAAEVEHSHMLFLPHPYKTGRKHDQIVHALERLIDRLGEANYLDCTLKLTFPANPNGIYLLKGGWPEVWRKYGVAHCLA